MTKRIKTICLFILATVLSASVSAQTYYTAYKTYIEDNRDAAMETMKKFNVPASILLAQGMLESVGGTSPLAVEANNHFGIVCYDSEGETFMYKASEFDTEETCFQKYADAATSFDDQARIFKLNSRYKVLAQYTPDNYQAWAKALQHVGYAPSPDYAEHLINLIDHYKLYKYDKQALKERNSSSKDQAVAQRKQERLAKAEAKKAEREAAKAERAAARAEKVAAKADKEAMQALEDAEKAEKNTVAKTAETVVTTKSAEPIVVNQNFNVGESRLLRQYDVDRVNGIKFILAQEGDTYFSLARRFDINQQELLRFNDIPAEVEITLKKGDLVYLQMKRPVAARGYEYHQVLEGESMYSIAQMYAIRLTHLYRMNKMNASDQLSVGEILKLR
jgi:hypothetical protein